MAKQTLSLIDIQSAFGSEEQCLSYIEAARWPEGVRCLKCETDKVSKFITNETTRERKNRKGEITEVRVPARHLYQCNAEGCRYQFSATTCTIFADTHLPLTKWFLAIGLTVNAKKGISAKQLERDLGIHYRSAWHLNHRIREAMQSEQGLFGGTVEIDATFVGGAFDQRRKRARYDKQAVAGVLQRGTENTPSKVKAFPIPVEIKPVMWGVIRDHISLDSMIHTDDHGAYRGLKNEGLKHEITNHSRHQYVRGNVHSNGIEGFWSLFKRGVIGSFHQVSVKHLHRYLNEFSFRFNGRDAQYLFGQIVTGLVIGSALRYATLVSSEKPSEPSPSE